MREAILAVSFGTTVDQARSRDLGGGAGAVRRRPGAAPLPGLHQRSGPGAAGDRGIAVPDVAGALEQMAAEGIECPLIVPTHLLPGAEYDKNKGDRRPVGGPLSRAEALPPPCWGRRRTCGSWAGC